MVTAQITEVVCAKFNIVRICKFFPDNNNQ